MRLSDEDRKKWIARFNDGNSILLVLFVLSIFSRYAVFAGIFWGLAMACNGAMMLLSRRDEAQFDILFITASAAYAFCELVNIAAMWKGISWAAWIGDNVGLFCLILMILLLLRKARVQRL